MSNRSRKIAGQRKIVKSCLVGAYKSVSLNTNKPFVTSRVLETRMTDLIVFDKDGVILDLEATWLPVARAVAQYTASRIPDD